jgi:hypothetical protein
MSWWSKVVLVARIWIWFVRVRLALRADPLPRMIEHLRPDAGPIGDHRLPARRLSGIVRRSLGLTTRSRRCLPSSLVLYRLLLEQGDPAHLVIGIPAGARSRDAHAWVEVDGVNLGPSPDGRRLEELARYG